MPSFEILIAFLATASAFAYMPGPGTLYTPAQTSASGRSAGLTATLGLHPGGYVYLLAAAAGLSVLFHAVPVMHTVPELVGAAFLNWLGIKLIVHKTGLGGSLPAGGFRDVILAAPTGLLLVGRVVHDRGANIKNTPTLL